MQDLPNQEKTRRFCMATCLGKFETHPYNVLAVEMDEEKIWKQKSIKTKDEPRYKPRFKKKLLTSVQSY